MTAIQLARSYHHRPMSQVQPEDTPITVTNFVCHYCQFGAEPNVSYGEHKGEFCTEAQMDGVPYYTILERHYHHTLAIDLAKSA